MASVLVSGAPLQAARLSDALRGQGAEITQVTDLEYMPGVCADAGADAFDAYVQLSSSFQMWGETAVERVHHFYAGGVLARFTAMRSAVSTLRTGARVIFVLGRLPAEVASQDDRDARESLTKVLIKAARADATAQLSTRILDSDTTVDDIVAAALGSDSESQQLLAELSDLDYADWRVEVLGLAALDT